MRPVSRICLPGLALLAVLGGADLARAELRFDATELTVKPTKAGETKLTAEFGFTNAGAQPITITEVSSSCGCTAPAAPKDAIAPGERGVLPVVYAAGGRQGPQRQTVRVKTSDGVQQTLVLLADLPVRVVFAPRMLLFRGGEAAAKTATVTFGDDLPVELLGVESTGAAFELAEPARLEGKELKLAVRFIGQPGENERGVLRVRTRGKSGAEHTDLLYARHMP